LFVEVQVADTGNGFSAEVREHLFAEPFFSTKPRHRGLGLAVVYGILRCYHGGLAIENGLRGGGVVRLYFPVSVKDVEFAPTTPTAASEPADRVLVVDDDPMVLQLVCATLQQAGYRVQSASGGAEALATYAGAGQTGFGLVLSDVVMPRISGIDLARQLLSQDANVNVLFMSGQVTADFAPADCFPGRFELLLKPFRPEGLLRAVRKALLRRHAVAPAETENWGPVPLQASS
jgi:CheY-like chemotaxis protein